MQLISVNIGRAERIANAKASRKTGIYKRPAGAPTEITAAGLAGDTVCNTKHPGGADQAVYVYGALDYDWWQAELGRQLEPGTFGENLTISAFESAACSIGDRIQIGSVTLEVTAPRIPCATLATRMGDPTFVRRFRAAERPGLYCRVVQGGFVQVGDAVALEPYAGATITALEMFRDAFAPQLSEATLRRQLAAPIAARARAENEAQLRALLAQMQS